MLLPTCFEKVVTPGEDRAVSSKQAQIHLLIRRSKRESFVSLASKRGSFLKNCFKKITVYLLLSMRFSYPLLFQNGKLRSLSWGCQLTSFSEWNTPILIVRFFLSVSLLESLYFFFFVKATAGPMAQMAPNLHTVGVSSNSCVILWVTPSLRLQSWVRKI